MVFIVVTAYTALSLPLGGSDEGRLIRARLILEAGVALAVLMGLARRPGPSRLAAVGLAAFVLIGCIPHLLASALPELGDGATALEALSVVIALAGCGSQAVVLAACVTTRDAPDRPAAADRPA